MNVYIYRINIEEQNYWANRYIENKKTQNESFGFCGGRRGIRTPGGVTLAGFQDQCIRPLCHSS